MVITKDGDVDIPTPQTVPGPAQGFSCFYLKSGFSLQPKLTPGGRPMGLGRWPVGPPRGRPAHLSDRVGQSLHNLLVGCGHHALPVDLDDAVADADAPSLGNASPHEAADLSKTRASQHTVPTTPARHSLLSPAEGEAPTTAAACVAFVCEVSTSF